MQLKIYELENTISIKAQLLVTLVKKPFEILQQKNRTNFKDCTTDFLHCPIDF